MSKAEPFPFNAIVGQDEMKLALLITSIDPGVGGVLVFGERGTGKSTAVRALANLLPKIRIATNCRYHCDPDPAARDALCESCAKASKDGELQSRLAPVPVVDLPLGASEDRVVGSLDLELALTRGEKAFEPGLLASAHRGFLYIDEVNLLEDHLVDLLLDVAASGENVVEREGLSVRHPARFVLIGTGNPEEGELRPQLLDRFGLAVDVTTPTEVALRVEVVQRRIAYEQDPKAFNASYKRKDGQLRTRLKKGRERLHEVEILGPVLESAAGLCMKLGTDGLRGELTLIRAARALAAFEGADAVTDEYLKRVAPLALRHRFRRDPLDEAGSTVRVERAMREHFGE